MGRFRTLGADVGNGWKADIGKRSLFGMTLASYASAIAAILMIAGTPVGAAASGDEPECFDAQVHASILRQTPTIIPDSSPECGPNCIIMSWPWILELDVKRVLDGHVSSNPITVLRVQHAYQPYGESRWWLRRNSLGAYNVLRGDDVAPLPRCPLGTGAAKPYVDPPTGKTLADLEREGEAHYGERP